jgi:hypothetical protein
MKKTHKFIILPQNLKVYTKMPEREQDMEQVQSELTDSITTETKIKRKDRKGRLRLIF